jgi:hypothetical protein
MSCQLKACSTAGLQTHTLNPDDRLYLGGLQCRVQESTAHLQSMSHTQRNSQTQALIRMAQPRQQVHQAARITMLRPISVSIWSKHTWLDQQQCLATAYPARLFGTTGQHLLTRVTQCQHPSWGRGQPEQQEIHSWLASAATLWCCCTAGNQTNCGRTAALPSRLSA